MFRDIGGAENLDDDGGSFPNFSQMEVDPNFFDQDGETERSRSPPIPAPRPKKMFWHAYHIDRVQELVPEEIR